MEAKLMTQLELSVSSYEEKPSMMLLKDWFRKAWHGPLCCSAALAVFKKCLPAFG